MMDFIKKYIQLFLIIILIGAVIGLYLISFKQTKENDRCNNDLKYYKNLVDQNNILLPPRKEENTIGNDDSEIKEEEELQNVQYTFGEKGSVIISYKGDSYFTYPVEKEEKINDINKWIWNEKDNSYAYYSASDIYSLNIFNIDKVRSDYLTDKNYFDDQHNSVIRVCAENLIPQAVGLYKNRCFVKTLIKDEKGLVIGEETNLESNCFYKLDEQNFLGFVHDATAVGLDRDGCKLAKGIEIVKFVGE